MADILIAINEKTKTELSTKLKQLLQDSYALYIQTHNYFWNVSRLQNPVLHMMFEYQYTELATAIGNIAKHMRELDIPVSWTYKTDSMLTSMNPVENASTPFEMINLLTQGHEQVLNILRSILKIAKKNNYYTTISLISYRIRIHEKMIWVLKGAHIKAL
ncbi:Dps family protein [Psychromonas sp. KJ10-10]|uniref:Dps family protein n=1 Tax=Psychromonas sp. KJ10-10 TaxID=3391823 RepID=UPI0039B4541E